MTVLEQNKCPRVSCVAQDMRTNLRMQYICNVNICAYDTKLELQLSEHNQTNHTEIVHLEGNLITSQPKRVLPLFISNGFIKEHSLNASCMYKAILVLNWGK